MSSLQDTFSGFFGKSVDGATGTAECLYCECNSSSGGGRWSDRSTWVCNKHIAQQDAEAEADRQKKRRAILHSYGEGGRGYLVGSYPVQVGDSYEYHGETFTVASVKHSPGGDNPNTDDYDPAGWYIKVR